MMQPRFGARLALVLLGCSLAAHQDARGEVRLAGIFTDNMMIQRDQPVRVWGLADPGEDVKVSLAGKSAAVQAGTNGHWSVELPALRTGENLELAVAGRNTITCRNVIVGDIWLCGGQSNMEFPLERSLAAAGDIQRADLPGIRSFKMNVVPSYFPEEHISSRAPWTVCSTQTAGKVTGVGFYFAREVHQKTGVPIGLLDVNVGGTIIEAWSSDWASADARQFSQYVDAMEKWVASARAALKDGRLTASSARAKMRGLQMAFLPEDQPKPPEGSVSTNGLAEMEQWLAEAQAAVKSRQLVNARGVRLREPPVVAVVAPADKSFPGWPWFGGPSGGGWYGVGNSFLYRGMVFPLLRFPIKGILWYQGESNGISGRHDNNPVYTRYAEKLQAFIADWRQRWNVGACPFYIVQLASWGEPNPDPAGNNGWTFICEAQLKTLAVTNTGLAVTIDIGDRKDIHPRNKYDVGLRLARWALARDYGQKDLEVSGPLYREMKIEGGRIRIAFDHAGSGLMIGKKTGRAPVVEDQTNKLARFAIAASSNQWFWAEAAIDGNTVVVSSPEVKAPVAVRYAYSQNPEGANLYNREGLPASPFRTDNW